MSYIYNNKTIKFIKLDDPNKFSENIKELNKNNAEEIHLSSEQFKNFITLNGGHAHWHILEQEQFNHIDEYVKSRGTPASEPDPDKIEDKKTSTSSTAMMIQTLTSTTPATTNTLPSSNAEEQQRPEISAAETKYESEPDQDEQKNYQSPTPSSTKLTPDTH